MNCYDIFPEVRMDINEFNSLPTCEEQNLGFWNRCEFGYKFTVGDTNDGLVGVVVPVDMGLYGHKVDRQLVDANRAINYYRPILFVST